MTKKFNIAIVGATGMVGRKMLEILEEKQVRAENYYLFASKNSAGKTVKFMGAEHAVLELNTKNICSRKIDIALFSAGAAVSKEYAPIFAATNTIVIDNSSQWRRDPNVPLIVPECNIGDLENHHNIIANPNCSTIQAVVALAPLHRVFKIKRIVYSTYQAVSGAGLAGMVDLENTMKGLAPGKFPKPIFNNIIPHIDVFLDNGNTKEEEKMIFETKKILNAPQIRISATTVRVPVFNCHSESVNVEFEKRITIEEVREILKSAPGVAYMDDPANNVYPTPLFAYDKDEVFVGRVRIDESVENGINMWIVADNVRKGAATNAVQIAEYIISNYK